MKRLFAVLALVILTMGCVSVTYRQVYLPEGEVLAEHRTVARYEGITEQPCSFMTAQCPNECDHGGSFATFAIERYIDYRQCSAFGDPKQETFALRLLLKGGTRAPETSPALVRIIEDLKKGEKVELNWVHLYRSTENGHFPERLITHLEK